jgi:Protein of unknown function (DUF3995)
VNVPGFTSVTILLAIAALHVAWAFGVVWPGHDAQSLAQKVVGGRVGMLPPPKMACLAVALALLVACGLILGLFGSLSYFGTFGVSVVLALRGIGGFFDVYLRPVTRGSPFARLNIVLYSPLCVALSVLVWMSNF